MNTDQTDLLHVVQFSTGIGSAEVARRVVGEHGAERVELLTADTLVEDDDNWRFARQVVALLGVRWTVLAEGRTPMKAGRDSRVVPNNRMAVCSRVLKRDLLRAHIDKNYDPANTVIHLGFDWTEPHRFKAAAPHWEPWTIDAVLTRPPYTHKGKLLEEWRERGIEPPILYAQGFSHANCGGACVRGGQAQWNLLLNVNRNRYLQWESEEEATRDLLGKDVSILRDRSDGQTVPLTLRRFRQEREEVSTLFDADDWGSCGCFNESETEDGAP
jgi:hypothetical protein